MNKKKYYSKREISCKGTCITKEGDSFLHPITLEIIKLDNNNNSVCPTEFHYDETNKSNSWYNFNCKNNIINSNFDTQKFMALPYLSLSLYQIINFYDIQQIDQLIKWIDKNIDEHTSYTHVIRILNIWIKYNHSVLINNNKILSNIYIKIYKKYWKKINIKEEQLKKELNKFISEWLKKNNNDTFEYNISKDLNIFLVNKYGNKK